MAKQNQTLDLAAKGLWTSPNEFSGIPEGGLTIANNVVIDNIGVVQSRRGQTQYGNPLTIGTGQVNKLFNFARGMVVSYDNKLAYDSGNGVWVDYSGTYLPPSEQYKMRSLEAMKNFYFTSNEGVMKLDRLQGTPRVSGVVQALNGTFSLVDTTGFLQADTAVAYQMIWTYTDANGNLLRGAPSQRLVVSNTNVGVQAAATLAVTTSITLTSKEGDADRNSSTLTTEINAAAPNPTDVVYVNVVGTESAIVIIVTPNDGTNNSATPVNLTTSDLTSLINTGVVPGKNVVLSDSLGLLRLQTASGGDSTNMVNGGNGDNVVATFAGGVDPDTHNVMLTFTMPSAITTDYKYQIYRSPASFTAADEPSTELYQVLEGIVTPTDVSNGYIQTKDITPYTLTGATLYTSPSQEGDENANYQPPFAIDMDVFKGSAFYANVRQKQRLSTTLIGAAWPSITYTTPDATYLNGDVNVTVDSTAQLRVGMKVIHADFPANTFIASIVDGTNITVSEAPTASKTAEPVECRDRFSISTVDFWAGSVQDPATNTFLVSKADTPAKNIEITSMNLIACINSNLTNQLYYAYYMSSVKQTPGAILIEARTLNIAEFFLTSTAGSSFLPVVPEGKFITQVYAGDPTAIDCPSHGLTTGQEIKIYGSNTDPLINGTHTVTVLDVNTFTIPVVTVTGGTQGMFVLSNIAVESTNEARQNRVYISKPGQVEAVPLYSYFDVGSANFPIERCVALRDGIFFFKPDGIYRLTGEQFSNFNVTLLDNTVTLRVPESAVPFNNQIFCYTSQGICAVSDSGVQIMSVPIENVLLELSSDQYEYFSTASFGVAYESSRQYLFFTVTEEEDTFATQAFVYNSLTKTWTRWIMSRTCGVVNTAVNKLFMAQADSGQILIERKSYTNQDYADEQWPVAISAVGGSLSSGFTYLTLTDASIVNVGYTIKQGGTVAYVEAINSNILTIKYAPSFAIGAAEVYKPIKNQVRWAPLDASNPGIVKQFSEATFLFKNAAFREIDADFDSNFAPGPVDVALLSTGEGGWGTFPWGSQPWGGQVGGQTAIRTFVPMEKQRAIWINVGLTIEEAFNGFALEGISFVYKPMSTRFR